MSAPDASVSKRMLIYSFLDTLLSNIKFNASSGVFFKFALV